MSRLAQRIERLEDRARQVLSVSPDNGKLKKSIEDIASRLNWDEVSADWAAKQSPSTIIAIALHGPALAVEAALPRLHALSRNDDATGRMAHAILELENEST